ncbi:preprotein translocase subunit SecA [uncultured Paludibaculum sp.]|uniref:preprotein translocase subunit SecA n=1 Tax=uncultured Paludibaculum sp. TaxID=1765020 RepID=UPI002AAB6B46|nr:preprotein translocase subunit SecA [uncultured Paludibaculum sp.]
MVDSLLAKIFGTQHEREIKKLKPLLLAINEREAAVQALTDEQLAAKTSEFRQQLADGATLDDILVDAFAVVREAGRRILNMRHFDSQLIGGIVLHKGKIAEMKTGEGKTLVATLPVYLNALAGEGVHVVTVNDYLARRDSEWMGRLYKFLGLSVGLIVHGLDDDQRYAAYHCDITYGTNNEYGFDYLRDNMKFRLSDCVQRGHNFAIVDEVDSILIDEARTPLIISGPSEESTDKYFKVNGIIPKLIRGEVIEGREPGEKYTTGDYTVDERHRSVALTEEGVGKVERLLNVVNLYDPENLELNHHVQQGLRAHVLYQRDRDYIIKDGEVIIVDEFTGRLMPGRRWSDGLHQAVEAKEGVKIERENQTLATVTFQNYFRMYKKLSGMTGTADTEAAEFGKIYNLDVTLIPTNAPMVRKDLNDIVYRTEDEKWRNAAKEIAERSKTGQPVLVGTISVEKSEKLGGILKRMGVKHEVLNAKNHEREAYIIAQAGRYGGVTVSTNMAGRGTDILLGGNPEFLAQEDALKLKLVESIRADEAPLVADHQFYYFQRGDMHYRVPLDRYQEIYSKYKEQCAAEHIKVVEAGGLCIVGTERHESRRIDNQLRGRAGRQGDPGSSRFFLSLQDDLLRVFGGDRIQGLMLRLGMEEDVPIESKLITKRIAAAQKTVEAQNFASRKHVKEYDDVMDKQRKAIYGLRRQLLDGSDMKEKIFEIVDGILATFIDARCSEGSDPYKWDLTGLATDINSQFGLRFTPADVASMTRVQMEEYILEKLRKRYDEKEEVVGPEVMRETERMIWLSVIDQQWKDHLLSMDHLKEGIGMRAYGQKDPLIEYKKEGFQIFQEMMDRIEDETIRFLFFLQAVRGERPDVPMPDDSWPDEDDEDSDLGGESAAPAAPSAADQKEAQASFVDLTRNIQKKKEREMEMLQFTGGAAVATPAAQVIKGDKVGRNDPCPCGSGKKYKKCHGS